MEVRDPASHVLVTFDVNDIFDPLDRWDGAFWGVALEERHSRLKDCILDLALEAN